MKNRFPNATERLLFRQIRDAIWHKKIGTNANVASVPTQSVISTAMV